MSFFEEEVSLNVKVNTDPQDKQQLAAMEKQITSMFASYTRGALAAGVSHVDVKNMLQSMRQQLEGLKKSAPDPGLVKYLTGASQAVAPNKPPISDEHQRARLASKLRQDIANKKQLEEVNESVAKTIADFTLLAKKLPRILNVLIMDIEATIKHPLELHARVVQWDTEQQRFGKRTHEYTVEQRYPGIGRATAAAYARALPFTKQQIDAHGAKTYGSAMVERGDRRYLLPADARMVGNKGLDLVKMHDKAPGISGTRLNYMFSKADVMVGHWPNQDLMKLMQSVPGFKGPQNVPVLDSSRDIPWHELGFKFKGLQPLREAHGIVVSGRSHRAASDVDANEMLVAAIHKQALGNMTYMRTLLAPLFVGNEADEYMKVSINQAVELLRDTLGQIRGGTRYYVPDTDHDPDRPEQKGRITAKGTGPAQDTTPTDLDEYGKVLYERKGVLQEFLRNTMLVDSRQLNQLVLKNKDIQEKRSTTYGNSFMSSRDTIMGEDIFLRMLRGVNAEVDSQRRDPNKFVANTSPLLEEGTRGSKAEMFARMLTQPSLRGAQPFPDEAITKFVNDYLAQPKAGLGITASQMALQTGLGDPRYWQLAEIALASQGLKRTRRRGAGSGGPSAASSAVIDFNAVSGPIRPESVLSKAGGVTLDIFKATNQALNKMAKEPGANSGGVFGNIFSEIADQYRAFRAKRAASESSTDGPDATFKRMHDSAKAAADGLDDLDDTLRGRGKGGKPGEVARDAPGYAIDQALSAANRRARRRAEDHLSGADQTTSRLGLAEVDASLMVEAAERRQRARIAEIRSSKKFQDMTRNRYMSDDEKEEFLEDVTAGPLRRAQINKAKTEYNRRLFEATTPEETDAARRQLATAYAIIKHGAPPMDAHGNILPEKEGVAAARNELGRQVYSTLVGDSTGQVSARKRRRITEDLSLAEVDAIDKTLAAQDKITKARKKAAGKGAKGGGGGKGAAETDEYDDFASRGGMMWGLGAASLVAYGKAMKEVIADSVIYAARTQTMVLVTDQMAKVNGLNGAETRDQVERIKELNITTQEAHSTVQKMIFAQLDVAKATQLARTAQDAAILGNVNSSEALEKIILGITTGQTRLLHNMGLQVSLIQVIRDIRLDKRARGDKSEPTEVEKRQGMLNKVLLEGAKIAGTYERAMLTAGKQFNSLQREVQETQNAIGKNFLPVFGRMVSQMSTGLGFVRENSDEFSHLASILLSLSSAAATVGTGAFISWLIKTPAVPLPVKGLAGLAAIGTNWYLNQDPAKAAAETAGEQQASINTKRAKLLAERDQILAAGPQNNPNYENDLKTVNTALDSYARAQVAIEKELTQQLAEEYNKRLADNQEFQKSLRGEKGKGSQWWAWANGDPSQTSTWDRWWTANGVTDPLKSAQARAKGMFEIPTPGGITKEQVLKAAEQQRLEADRVASTPATTIDREKVDIEIMAANFQHARAEMLKQQELFDPKTGRAALKAEKFMGGAREKVRLDRDVQIERIDMLLKQSNDLEKTMKTGTPEEAAKATLKYREFTKKVGGGDYTVGESRISDMKRDRDTTVEYINRAAGIQEGKITRAREADILAIKNQTDLARIQRDVIDGNAASELDAIQKIFDKRSEVTDQTYAKLNDFDQYKKSQAQNEAERQTAIIKLEERRIKNQQKLVETMKQAEAEAKANEIMESPGDHREGLMAALTQRMIGAKSIKDDSARASRLMELVLGYKEDTRKLDKSEPRLKAQGDVAGYKIQSELQSEIERITEGKGRYSRERALSEIKRSGARAEDVENYEFNKMRPFIPREELAGAEQQRNINIAQIRAQTTANTIKELDQQVEAARQRLAETYNMQYQRMERINELQAMNAADEEATAYNTHVYRLELIQKEYEAAGETQDALADRDKKLQDAKFDQLQKQLEMRKREMDGLRNVSGQVYDSLLEGGKKAIGDLAMSHLKATGRTMFQNVMGLGFSGARGVLGSIIPGQERKDSKGIMHTSILGKILGGTVFAPSHTGDIQQLLADVTKDSVKAELELKKSIDSLNEAVRTASGQAPGVGGGAAGAISAVSSIPGLSKIPGASGGMATLASINRLFSGSAGGNAMTAAGSMGGMTGMLAMADAMSVNGGSAGPLSVNIPTSFGMPASMQAQMAGETFNSGDMIGSVTGVAGKKVPGWQQALTGFGGGALGQYNMLDVFGNKSSVRMMGGGATAMSGAQRLGAAAGMAATVAGGVMQSIGGFKEGGAKGIVSGIGGILTAASVIPGPQQPFVMAGALMAGFVSSIMKSKTEDRKKEIDEVMKNTKFVAPVEVKLEMGANGNLLSYDKYGNPRDTGVSAFPVSLQQNAYRPSIADEDQEVFLPGRVLENTASSGNVIVNYYTTVPVSTMDSRSFMDNSRMVAAALQKELRGSTDMGITLQNAVFGV